MRLFTVLTAVFLLSFSACDHNGKGPDLCGDGEISAADAVWSHGEGDLQNTKKASAARIKGCLNAPVDTPTIQWSFEIGGGGTGAIPVFAEDGTTYLVGEYPGVPAGGGVRNIGLMAISNSGQLKWFFSKPYDVGPDGTGLFTSRSVSLSTNGVLYIGFWDSTFYSLQPDGNVIWSFRSDFSFASNAVIDKAGNVYCSTDSIFSFSPSGELRWRFGSPDYETACTRLALGKNTIFARYPAKGVVALDYSGNFKWFYPIVGFTGHYGILIDEEDNIYFKVDNSNIVSLDKNGSFRWAGSTGGLEGMSEPVLRGDHIFFASFTSLYRVHKDSGNVANLIATYPNYIDPDVSPLVDDNGNIVVASRWGAWQSVQHIPANTPLIACVTPKGTKLWEIPIIGAEFCDFMSYLALSPTGQIVAATFSGGSQENPTNRLYLLH